MMNQSEAKTQLENVLEKDKVGVLATVQKGKPHARYMTFFHEEMILYTVTNKHTHKMEDMEENANVHILLGYGGDGYGDEYVEVEGKVSMKESKALKEKLWTESMNNYFDGPEDPEYIVLEIKPMRIRFMNQKGKPTQTVEI